VAILAQTELECDLEIGPTWSFMQCPKCKTDSAHRSHREGLQERLTSLVGYFPYRCRQCSHRFLTFSYSLPERAAHPTRGAEREIAATRGSLRWKQRRREVFLYCTALALFVVILYYLSREPSMGG
jgi:hypothetical protein